MKNKAYEYLLVFIQFATMAYLVLTTSWFSISLWAVMVVISAAGLAIWAIASMQVDNLRVAPSPAEQARLVTRGPYRLIRHPMYASLLLSAIPLIIEDFSYLKLTLGILLLIDLLVKLNYEERLLLLKFPGYKEYRERTFHILPFLY